MGYIYIYISICIFIYIYILVSFSTFGKTGFLSSVSCPKKEKLHQNGASRSFEGSWSAFWGKQLFYLLYLFHNIRRRFNIIYIHISYHMPIQRDLSYSGCLYKGNRVLCIVFSLKLKPIPDFFAQGPLKLTRFPKMLSQSV